MSDSPFGIEQYDDIDLASDIRDLWTCFNATSVFDHPRLTAIDRRAYNLWWHENKITVHDLGSVQSHVMLARVTGCAVIPITMALIYAIAYVITLVL